MVSMRAIKLYGSSQHLSDVSQQIQQALLKEGIHLMPYEITIVHFREYAFSIDFAELFVEYKYSSEVASLYLNSEHDDGYYEFFQICFLLDQRKTSALFQRVAQAIFESGGCVFTAPQLLYLASFCEFNQLSQEECESIMNYVAISGQEILFMCAERLSRNVRQCEVNIDPLIKSLAAAKGYEIRNYVVLIANNLLTTGCTRLQEYQLQAIMELLPLSECTLSVVRLLNELNYHHYANINGIHQISAFYNCQNLEVIELISEFHLNQAEYSYGVNSMLIQKILYCLYRNGNQIYELQCTVQLLERLIAENNFESIERYEDQLLEITHNCDFNNSKVQQILDEIVCSCVI